MTPKKLAKVLMNPKNARWTIGELTARLTVLREVRALPGFQTSIFEPVDQCLIDLGLVITRTSEDVRKVRAAAY